jgi:hypothetical protein
MLLFFQLSFHLAYLTLVRNRLQEYIVCSVHGSSIFVENLSQLQTGNEVNHDCDDDNITTITTRTKQQQKHQQLQR